MAHAFLCLNAARRSTAEQNAGVSRRVFKSFYLDAKRSKRDAKSIWRMRIAIENSTDRKNAADVNAPIGVYQSAFLGIISHRNAVLVDSFLIFETHPLIIGINAI